MIKKYAYLDKNSNMIIYFTSHPLDLEVYEVEVEEDGVDGLEEAQVQIKDGDAILVQELREVDET